MLGIQPNHVSDAWKFPGGEQPAPADEGLGSGVRRGAGCQAELATGSARARPNASSWTCFGLGNLRCYSPMRVEFAGAHWPSFQDYLPQSIQADGLGDFAVKDLPVIRRIAKALQERRNRNDQS